MTELTIQIKNPFELEQLLPILQELKINYQSRTVKQPKRKVDTKEAILAKIKAGVFNIPHFPNFMQDFELSRLT